MKINRRDAIEKQIEKIDRQRALLKTRRDRLRQKLTENTDSPRNSMTEYEFFKSEDLVIYIEKYLTDHGMMISTLAVAANVSPKTIRRIRNVTFEYTTFTTADRIFTAMNIPQVLDALPRYDSPHLKIAKIPSPPPSHYYED